MALPSHLLSASKCLSQAHTSRRLRSGQSFLVFSKCIHLHSGFVVEGHLKRVMRMEGGEGQGKGKSHTGWVGHSVGASSCASKCTVPFLVRART